MTLKSPLQFHVLRMGMNLFASTGKPPYQMLFHGSSSRFMPLNCASSCTAAAQLNEACDADKLTKLLHYSGMLFGCGNVGHEHGVGGKVVAKVVPTQGPNLLQPVPHISWTHHLQCSSPYCCLWQVHA